MIVRIDNTALPYSLAGMQVPQMKNLLADVKTPKWYLLGLELANDEIQMRIIEKKTI